MKKILKKLFDVKRETSFQKANNKLKQKTEEELKSEIEKLQINGYHLPQGMIKRMTSDNWKEPINKKHLEGLIVQNCPFEGEVRFLKEMINDFTLFSLGLMKSESECLIQWLDPKWEKDRVMLLGQKDDKIYPGNIEHDKVILFADFGHGSDTCFALDFRENENSPIVILEYWGENPQTDNRWKKIANSFEEFERIIWKQN